MCVRVSVCVCGVCVYVCVCVRACERASVRACVCHFELDVQHGFCVDTEIN